MNWGSAYSDCLSTSEWVSQTQVGILPNTCSAVSCPIQRRRSREERERCPTPPQKLDKRRQKAQKCTDLHVKSLKKIPSNPQTREDAPSSDPSPRRPALRALWVTSSFTPLLLPNARPVCRANIDIAFLRLVCNTQMCFDGLIYWLTNIVSWYCACIRNELCYM